MQLSERIRGLGYFLMHVPLCPLSLLLTCPPYTSILRLCFLIPLNLMIWCIGQYQVHKRQLQIIKDSLYLCSIAFQELLFKNDSQFVHIDGIFLLQETHDPLGLATHAILLFFFYNIQTSISYNLLSHVGLSAADHTADWNGYRAMPHSNVAAFITFYTLNIYHFYLSITYQ